MQQSPEFLTVTNLGEVKADKNGVQYRQVFLKGNDVRFITLPNGQVISAKTEAKETSVNAYSERYLDQKPDFAWNLKKGDVVLGAIVTREVLPYEIPDRNTGEMRTVTTYSRIVFGDTTSPAFEAAVKREFQAQGHTLAHQVAMSPVPAMEESED